MVEKVVMYKLTDGRTVPNRGDAIKEQLKIDTLLKIGPAMEKLGPNAAEVVGAAINVLIDKGWRPPAKKYNKAAKAASEAN